MTIFNALPYNLQNGQTADATQVMANYNQIVNDGNTNGAHNGANADITSLTGITTPIPYSEGGSGQTTVKSFVPWAAAAGTADAITAAYTPANGSLIDGMILGVRASAANATTTPTFAPDGLTAHTITKWGGSPVAPGDIPKALSEFLVRYNLANTRWELLNPVVAPYCMAVMSTTQTVNAGTTSTVNFDTASFDNMGWFDTVNHRYLPLIAGKYKVTLMTTFSVTANANTAMNVNIQKTGAIIAQNGNYTYSATGASFVQNVSVIASMNGSTDYFSATLTNGSGSNGTIFNVNGVGVEATILIAEFLGP